MARLEADRSLRASSALSRSSVLFLVVLVLACCLPSFALADPPATTKAGKRPPFDVSLAMLGETGDVNGIVAIRAGEIFAAPGMAKHAAMINQVLSTQLVALGMPFNLPVKVQEIDQIVVHITLKIDLQPVQKSTSLLGLTAVRMKKPFDWAGFIKRELPNVRERKKDGVTWYELDRVRPGSDGKQSETCPFYPVDDRTIVMHDLTIEKLIEGRKKRLPKPPWAAEYKEVEGGLVAILLCDRGHSYAAKCARASLPANLGQEEKELSLLEVTIARTASRVVLGLDGAEGISLSARFTCDKPADAVELEKACRTFKKLFRGASMQKEFAGRATIQRAGNQVIVTAKSKFGLERLLKLFDVEMDDRISEPYNPSPPPPPSLSR
jgi:hypothetical protein